jgi:hypothetical protein
MKTPMITLVNLGTTAAPPLFVIWILETAENVNLAAAVPGAASLRVFQIEVLMIASGRVPGVSEMAK